MSLCHEANLVVCVAVWALPRCFCFAVFVAKRKNLAGGFAGCLGFLVVGCFFVDVMICLLHGPIESLYKIAFHCLRFCQDRALVRHRPNRRKKRR